MSEDLAASPLALLFNKANVFTVWRPTSDEAIKNMMLGIATGKGLDIKGKSAKRVFVALALIRLAGVCCCLLRTVPPSIVLHNLKRIVLSFV